MPSSEVGGRTSYAARITQAYRTKQLNIQIKEEEIDNITYTTIGGQLPL